VEKRDIGSIAEKNRIIRNISRTLETCESFLIIGHENPDEDCIASMVSVALLISKFNKRVQIDLSSVIQDQFRYLINICRYNDIIVHEGQDKPDLDVHAVFIMDTPKPEMIGERGFYSKLLADPKVRKIEIDHHIGGDSSYCGEEGYRMVWVSSSSCELVGYLLMKLSLNRDFMKRNNLTDLFQRNIILSIITGMIADSHMGLYLKTKREKWFYRLFSSMFERMLQTKTRQGSNNFSSKEQLFGAIASLSSAEEECFGKFLSFKGETGRIHFVILDDGESRSVFDRYGADTVVAVSKALSDKLAESSGYLGLVAYRDDPALSPFIQFRLRRSSTYEGLDLRSVLEKLSIENGGGHPGAIGFRFERDKVGDMVDFGHSVMKRVNRLIEEQLS
jgi:nanoRNase/pAp phosphatase (c-di-AMP/oligoRNAs hydrolase)